VPLAAADQLATVQAPAADAADGVRLDRLRIEHPATRPGIPARSLADLRARPVGELRDQAGITPAAEERMARSHGGQPTDIVRRVMPLPTRRRTASSIVRGRTPPACRPGRAAGPAPAAAAG